MCGYIRKFIPDYACVNEPLRRLIKSNVTWCWSTETEEAFNSLKNLLASIPCLAYFRLEAKTFVICDASPVGLGAILLQKQEDGSILPIAFASRALTPIESRHSHTEWEALGCVWAVEHFRIYIWGKRFVLETDHKPLIHMLNQNRSAVLPLRIQKLIWRLQPYDYEIVHITGKDNNADFLSRLRLHTPETENIAEDYIRRVIELNRAQSMNSLCESSLWMRPSNS